MAVFRVSKTGDYTVMSNSHLREKGMSLKAKGLLSLMLSLPDDWDYSIQGLCTLSKDGYEGVMNALRELERYGYLTRSRATDERGHFAGYDYDIFERPQTENPSTGNPKAEKPQSDFPITENPSTGNPKQLNNNIPIPYSQNTEETNTPQPPKRQRRVSQLTLSQAESFARFWEIYPRKVAKESAEKAWAKIDPPEHLVSRIILAVENQKKVDSRFREIRFTPHPATWLNGREWENTYETGGTQNGGEFRPSTGFRTDF